MQMLDWGQVTPEAFNLEKNEIVYIYNHDLTSSEKIKRTIRFIIGRLNYYDLHLPKEPFHVINIDIRGQQIKDSMCNYIIQELNKMYPCPNSLTVSFVK